MNKELRNIKISRNFLDNPDGSVLVEMGKTKVICTAMIEEGVPFFLRGKNEGWLTAEYSMLPGSTIRRKVRESTRGKIEGRTQEIQRLIGRSLRAGIDLKKLGERTVWIDCDVIQADGGTRTASIVGGFVAMAEAIDRLYGEGKIEENPIKNYIGAVSVGITEDGTVLDMCYKEDFKAIVDMNIVMTEEGEFIELQGTGEQGSFSRSELNNILDIAEKGIEDIIEFQREVLKDNIIMNL